MNRLLKTNLFDTFEVREVTMHTAFKLVIDSQRNTAYFKNDEHLLNDPLSEFLSWGELRPYVYELMQGNRLPTYFKIILSTNAAKTLQISSVATTFYLNILFKEECITCSTGVAYQTFTLDKSADQLWDKRMEQFLLKYDFINPSNL